MLAMSSPRRLLVVDPCENCHELLPGLRTIGWAVDNCTLATVVDRSCDVNMLRLQPFHLERPEAVKDMVSRSGTEWIAALTGNVLKMSNVGNFDTEWFFDFHTLPFDVSGASHTRRAFGMACLRGQRAHTDIPQDELLGDSHALDATCARW